MVKKKGIVKSILGTACLLLFCAGGVALIARATSKDDSCKHDSKSTLSAVAPTCTEDGKTAGVVCNDCGDVIIKQETLLAKGHKAQHVSEIAPTCTENGLTAGVVCKDCGVVLLEQEYVSACGHTEKVLSAIEATCSQDGRTESVVCEDCGVVLTESQVIKAFGHNYVNGICVRCEDGTGYIETVSPTGYMYQKPSLNESVNGNIYRLGEKNTSIYLSLKSVVANKVFGVYGDHLGDIGTSYETNARFFVVDGYYYVEFPTDFFFVIDGVKYTDNAVAITGIDTIVGTTTTSATRLVSLDNHYSLWQTSGENIVFDESKLTFTGVGPAGLATINEYTNFELTFDVIENSNGRTYFAFGVGAPEVGSGLLESAFIQFNYDQVYICLVDGTTYNFWNQTRSWTISVTDGYLTLVTGEGDVVCQGLALGVSTGHITLQSAQGCTATLDNVVLSLYK